MILQIQTNSSITIQGSGHYPGASYSAGGWVDLIPLMAYGTLEGTTNSVDGPNAGRSIDNGYMIRDLLGFKEKLPIVTIPLLLQDCQALRNLIMREDFLVRTDYFTGALTTYDMYPGATVTITHIQNYEDGSVLAKIAFNLIEL